MFPGIKGKTTGSMQRTKNNIMKTEWNRHIDNFTFDGVLSCGGVGVSSLSRDSKFDCQQGIATCKVDI